MIIPDLFFSTNRLAEYSQDNIRIHKNAKNFILFYK